MFDRSYHFIPADRPELFERVSSLNADAYIFDLEDAVARSAKQAALSHLETWIAQQASLHKVYVRVNGHNDSLSEAERVFIGKYPALGIVIPKVNSAKTLSQAGEFYRLDTSRRVIGLIEDARGLMELSCILELKILQAVGLGLEDFLSHSIFETSQLATIVDHIRTKIALTAMAYGIDAIDTISIDISGGEQMRVDVANARSAGFKGKFSIHPNQIDPINEGFSPSPEAVGKAKMISKRLTHSDHESGYLRLEGQIISPPKLKKLETIKQFIDHHEHTNK